MSTKLINKLLSVGDNIVFENPLDSNTTYILMSYIITSSAEANVNVYAISDGNVKGVSTLIDNNINLGISGRHSSEDGFLIPPGAKLIIESDVADVVSVSVSLLPMKSNGTFLINKELNVGANTILVNDTLDKTYICMSYIVTTGATEGGETISVHAIADGSVKGVGTCIDPSQTLLPNDRGASADGFLLPPGASLVVDAVNGGTAGISVSLLPMKA